jgi:hypothetical protein
MRPSRRVEVRVIPRNQRWEVQVDGFVRPIVDWLATRERAVQYAFDQAIDLVGRGMSHVVIAVMTEDGALDELVGKITPAEAQPEGCTFL